MRGYAEVNASLNCGLLDKAGQLPGLAGVKSVIDFLEYDEATSRGSEYRSRYSNKSQRTVTQQSAIYRRYVTWIRFYLCEQLRIDIHRGDWLSVHALQVFVE